MTVATKLKVDGRIAGLRKKLCALLDAQPQDITQIVQKYRALTHVFKSPLVDLLGDTHWAKLQKVLASDDAHALLYPKAHSAA